MIVRLSALRAAGFVVTLAAAPVALAQQPTTPEQTDPQPAPQQSATQQAEAKQAQPDAQMQTVLDALKALQAEPFHTIGVPEARTQASAADAARTVQRDAKISPFPEAKVATKDIAIPTANGGLPARVYTPEGNGPFPVVLYFHGGGWVVADINTYDATPRALALGAKAIVVSADYRHAPESRFPAQHEDAWAAYEWTVENVHTLNGDARRIAVAGESAGGNLAANVALMAKAKKTTQPVHQLLVYPIAGNDLDTPSYRENANALPLGKADMEWFISHVFTSKDQAADTRINLVGRDDLGGLPPATIVTAQIDPLRSEGQALAEKMKAAGVSVNLINTEGTTHEFFGMGKVVDKAKAAVDAANADLVKAFAK
ncbi:MULTISPECIES: alpha/beta hydrolase [unclassified Rhizobium]|uniref:alpha/beta hydrolase n=1 Tax=unclassified Rhizobium TaxID=2613769 RepID=UPI000B0BABE9|nr:MULTISPECIES: alpha/beta hydrolase [unclassified Rhizobium]